ncbi:nucleotidyltransferase [Planctomycetales bacterium]|nr:nucleotidyltransferase [Planctomycetales bacterium]GHS96440.1 nucleotidyltransferase [Planctomycetales bacterium]GHT02967.1 nucleotidyltransferase [Planctomycetales bacterium]
MDSSPDTLDLTNLKNAVAALERAVKVYFSDEVFRADVDESLRGGVIQAFEFTYELCWKFMKRWLETNTTPAVVEVMFTKKELFRKSAELNLITDPVAWFGFSAARNKTSHTYDGDTADNVAAVAKEFLTYAKDFLSRLEQRL